MRNKNKIINKPFLIRTIAISVLFSTFVVIADDTEVFYSVNASKPNLLFVLDNSGSMNRDLNGVPSDSSDFTPPTRLNILKDAVKSVLKEAPDNVNIGVMRFGPGMIASEWYIADESKRTHGVDGVVFPLTDINALVRDIIPTSDKVYNLPYYPSSNETVRTYVAEVVDRWAASGGTPLVGAIYEAALYFRGEQMRYGLDAPNGKTGVGAHPSTYSGAVITNDITINPRDYQSAPMYISPIKSSCQENYIVLMSDGSPSYYYAGDAKVQEDVSWSSNRGPFAWYLQGRTGSSQLAAAISSCEDMPSGFTSGKCGAELTRYIADNDNSSTYADKQTIKTYSIVLGTVSDSAQEYLRSLETIDDDPTTEKVEDGYINATNPEDLAAAFKSILDDVSEPKGTMASPGYSVNVKSGLEHEKSIYIPVFDRKNTSRWSGNLKKFTIADVNGKRLIQGKNNKEAMDELGGFTADAWDEWSTSATPDGLDILKGGVAEKLSDPSKRKLYSNLSSTGDLIEIKTDLTSSSLSNTVLGISADSTDADRKKIVNYIRGWKDGLYDASASPEGIARKKMGDMLHSEPYVFTYGEGEQYIFTGTNEGFLHAFNTETGEEKFAFMPRDLLKNIEPQFRNNGTARDHLYGIDGVISLWDKKGDSSNLDGVDGVYLYFGLRRGGRSYYALDVTDVDSPSLLWKVSASDVGFSSMGQSWSPPYLGEVGSGSDGKRRAAVIFSGGYDPIEDRDIDGKKGILDSSTKSVETTMGNDIFIVDAKTGQKIWSLQDEFGESAIRDSIPGGIRYLDTNYNHKIDRLYFADTGGNVWRVDLSEKLGVGESKLTKLASLGGSGSDARKFYNEPDVAAMKLKGKSVFLVSIGSGFRAHPLDKEINDEFFMLLDRSPYAPIKADSFEAIKKVDLATIEISDDGTGAGVNVTDSIRDPDKRGWRVTFPENGEKVLSTALAFDGVMTFTTLVPDALVTGVGIDSCEAPAVQGRFYAINVKTGKAGLYLNQEVEGTGELNGQGEGGDIPDINIRSKPISKEPPGAPQVVFNKLEVNTTTGECRHPVDIRIGKKLSQVTGYDTCRLESVYWSDPIKK